MSNELAKITRRRESKWIPGLRQCVLALGKTVLMAGVILAIPIYQTDHDPEMRSQFKLLWRMSFDPSRVWSALVLPTKAKDPEFVCWGPGNPIHSCPPGTPDPDDIPRCIEPTRHFPLAERAWIEALGGTKDWTAPFPCKGLRIVNGQWVPLVRRNVTPETVNDVQLHRWWPGSLPWG